MLANGSWLNVGGNNPILWGGIQSEGDQVGAAPYFDKDGGKAFRMLVCDNNEENCVWNDDESMYMTTRRWYPTLETLEDGSMFIISGCLWGGYVSGANQNNPTYEVSGPFSSGSSFATYVLSAYGDLFLSFTGVFGLNLDFDLKSTSLLSFLASYSSSPREVNRSLSKSS